MVHIAKQLKAYADKHPFHFDQNDSETVLEQLFWVYQEVHAIDTPEIKAGFRELDQFFPTLPSLTITPASQ